MWMDMHKSISVEKVMWFTQCSNVIGIIVVNNSRTKERKAYIGVGDGSSIERDIEYIVTHGVSFPLAAADFL